MNLSLVLLLVTASVTSTLAGCPPLEVLQNFDPQKFTGLWYEIERDPSPFQPSGDCTTTKYDYTQDKGTLAIASRMFSIKTGNYTDMNGVGRWKDPAVRDAKMLVKFPIAPIEGNIWVVDSDYTTFCVIHSCNNVFGMVIKMTYVLSRTPIFTPETRAKVDEVLKKSNLDISKIESTTQGVECKYE